IALALALMRKIPEADRSVRAGDWTRSKLIGRELRGKTLGLVGIGRVGSEVARRAAAFEMRVIAHDPFATEASARAAGAQLVELDELLHSADLVSLHTPLTEKTRNLINADALAKMKPTAVIVNCARGEVVDLAALAAALEAGAIAGAALDVYPSEPLPADSPIRGAPRTVLTPHIAGSTAAARYAAVLTVRVGNTGVAGTLVQGEPRIVLIDGFWVDVPVEGHLLLTKHQDKPGLVGRVGTLLGQHDVNISSMQVGRLHPR